MGQQTVGEGLRIGSPLQQQLRSHEDRRKTIQQPRITFSIAEYPTHTNALRLGASVG
jgi:hypothetical protein